MTYETRLAFALFLALASPAAAKELTLARLTALPALTGTAPLRPVWSRDSERIAFLWNDRAMPFRDVFVVDAASGGARRLTSLEGGGGGVSDVTWTPDGKALIFVLDGAMFRVSSDGAPPERLTELSAARGQLAFSPEGRYLSWVEDGDLWLWNQETTERVRATQLGAPPIGVVPGARNSRLDREIVSYRWSPDSRFVAIEIDDRIEGAERGHPRLPRRGDARSVSSAGLPRRQRLRALGRGLLRRRSEAALAFDARTSHART